MLRKQVRQRKEYLFQKALESREQTTFDKKKRLRSAIEGNKAIPGDLKADRNLRQKLDLEDDNTKNQREVMDDEYAYMGVKDPKVVVTTARDPSSRLMNFVKELRLLIPNSQRINRGGYVMTDLVEIAKKNEITDIVIVHEHRGEPDGLIISHLPHGPTAYFGMKDVVLRHDLATKPANMSEAAPHLVFHEFESKFGKRVQKILQALFPPAAPLGHRVLTFANHKDTIHFRHYNYTQGESNKALPEGENAEKKSGGHNAVDLSEVGPRFSLQLYRVELGTVDMKDTKTEWVLRPYFNKQRDVLKDKPSSLA